jgi:hypothetical protein
MSLKRSANSITPTFAGCAALSRLSGRFGREYCEKKKLDKYEQSQYVYENKQISDKMPGKSRTFMSKIRTFASNRHQFCRIWRAFRVKQRHFLARSLAARPLPDGPVAGAMRRRACISRGAFQGSVKVDRVEGDPSPTALRSPLSPMERAVIFYPSPGGERRWVRGLFANDVSRDVHEKTSLRQHSKDSWKSQVADFKLLRESWRDSRQKRGGFKNAGSSHDVIENKRRGNVDFDSSHDIHENK